MIACRRSVININIVSALLKAGADIDVQNKVFMYLGFRVTSVRCGYMIPTACDTCG
jgi:hypothetical protein